MSQVLQCSHIFVVSENMDIVDLGEYGSNHLHVSNGYGKEILGKDSSGEIHIAGLPDNTPILLIKHPHTKTQQIFVTADEKVPITDIFSRSNKNDDCIIFGTVKGASIKLGETDVIIIEPYQYDNVTKRMEKEVEVLLKYQAIKSRYVEISEPKPKNPIIERIKGISL